MDTRRPVRVYVAPATSGSADEVFLLRSYYASETPNEKFLFHPTRPLHYNFELVKDITRADVVLVPQPLTSNDTARTPYFSEVYEAASRVGKPVAVFVGGDFSHNVHIDGLTILKGTQYRRFLKDNEIIIPPFFEDLGGSHGLSYRDKSTIPTVSFCGWAGFDTRYRFLKYCVKNFLVDIKKIIHLDPSREVFKQGLYFRRKSIRSLSRSKNIQTNFITRKTFSGNATTIGLSPAQARTEYVQNMMNSDFVLAPKGDANYSVRFFEALSFGRIPILIDTECCLPLEDTIDYSKCILRVSYKDLSRLGDIVAEFWDNLSDDDYVAMQKEARRVFETHLRYDSFFNTVLPRIVMNHTKTP